MGQCHGHIRPCHSDLISFYLPHLRFAITLKFHQRNCRILTPPKKKYCIIFQTLHTCSMRRWSPWPAPPGHPTICPFVRASFTPLGSVITDEVIVAVCGFAVGGNAMASRKVDSNVLIGLQGCQDLKGKTLKGDVGGKWWEGRPVIVFFFPLGIIEFVAALFCPTNCFQKIVRRTPFRKECWVDTLRTTTLEVQIGVCSLLGTPKWCASGFEWQKMKFCWTGNPLKRNSDRWPRNSWMKVLMILFAAL